MQASLQRLAFCLSVLCSITIAAVFLFIAIALVPYWQELSGEALQEWFAGPFTRFSIMMVPVHFLSLAALGLLYVLHRKTQLNRVFLLALGALLVCQGFNFTLYGAVLNPALHSEALAPEAALATLDRWDFFHNVRTFAVIVCTAALLTAVRTPHGAEA